MHKTISIGLAVVSCSACGDSPSTATRGTEAAPRAASAIPNDNRVAAGTLRDGVLELDLVARLAEWAGEDSDLAPTTREPSIVTVLGFAEETAVTIPGPLIRVPEGTDVRIRVRNSLPDSVSVGPYPYSMKSFGG